MPWFDNNDKPIEVNHTEMIERVENDIRLYGKDLKCYVIISSRSVANSPDIQIVSRFSLKKSIIGGMTDKEYALSITLEELLNRLRYEHYVSEDSIKQRFYTEKIDITPTCENLVMSIPSKLSKDGQR